MGKSFFIMAGLLFGILPNISQKDTPRQETIKHFGSGVVSYSFLHEIHGDIDRLLDRLAFLVDAGYAIEDMATALILIEKLVLEAKSEWAEMHKKAVKEANEAGGNDIYTISMNETLNLKDESPKKEATGGEVNHV